MLIRSQNGYIDYFVKDFDQMTDLSKSLRNYLKENTTLKLPKIALEKPSSDGTIKWMMRLDDASHNMIETVFIPEENRGTLCVSSQVGCMLTCSFVQQEPKVLTET